ncbi:hypothetical protein [Methylobacterium sp. J-076]|uniref:hypothetical protein n=1 Tax=Methylobacterium sp. J-076 TaxID=2836655 RepID=UPI001FBC0664|nr:hypothetical protein [Methylobacterium sp. J-076]MCJ2015574.1 hypothetical protein [Methylobacterium sp. J-076]
MLRCPRLSSAFTSGSVASPRPGALLPPGVSADATDDDLIVAFRPAFAVTRNSTSGRHPETEGRVEWSAEFEEA